MLNEVITLIANEPSFIYLMQECGDSRRLTVSVQVFLVLYLALVYTDESAKHKYQYIQACCTLILYSVRRTATHIIVNYL